MRVKIKPLISYCLLILSKILQIKLEVESCFVRWMEQDEAVLGEPDA